ncbi:hypothetical protein JB92DRAFT_2925290 [Gautieria morchelliformis]|nr:hypothetical protein JB92DRAFT_2925290 [Gautieria morchelliformis]
MRLQSDLLIARDPRMACTWQGFVNNQATMASAFKHAMAKMAVIGQDTHALIDCSAVVPEPVPAAGKPATFPATKAIADVLQACGSPFPSLATDPGASETIISHCPPTQTTC